MGLTVLQTQMNVMHLVPITARQTQSVLINLDRLSAIAELVTLEMGLIAVVGLKTVVPVMFQFSFIYLFIYLFVYLFTITVNILSR